MAKTDEGKGQAGHRSPQSVQALCSRVRGCSPGPAPASMLGPGWAGAEGQPEAGPAGPTPHLAACSGVWSQTTAAVPLLSMMHVGAKAGGRREQSDEGGGDSLQHVQKLLRSQELLAWSDPCCHIPDSEGLCAW